MNLNAGSFLCVVTKYILYQVPFSTSFNFYTGYFIVACCLIEWKVGCFRWDKKIILIFMYEVVKDDMIYIDSKGKGFFRLKRK